MKATAVNEYAFIFNNSIFYASLELNEDNRVVKTMFLPADAIQEREIKEFLKTNS